MAKQGHLKTTRTTTSSQKSDKKTQYLELDQNFFSFFNKFDTKIGYIN